LDKGHDEWEMLDEMDISIGFDHAVPSGIEVLVVEKIPTFVEGIERHDVSGHAAVNDVSAGFLFYK
jgi:hypothetical protein